MKKLIASLVLSILLSVVAFSPILGKAATSPYYTNISGKKVHAPIQAQTVPVGATAHCKDGTYSFSQHRRGTCSGHRGVAKWLE